ncbi:MAG: hypothetical protein RBT73_00185 [Spirochaetia bacterium]|nr:hypothetical protein [Spirochaetia bacterium]
MKPRTLLTLLFLAFLLSGPSVFAQTLGSFEKAGHLRTERFDIFYAPALAEEAVRLAGFADAVLQRQESLLGIKAPWKRLPVLLSDRSPSLNGYFTAFPSNRISIQLAKAKVSDELSSLADELKTIFIHELGHAVTMNARSPFWSALAWAMGDFFVPPGWIVPKMFSEGTAVWLESMDWSDLNGEKTAKPGRLPGRLNDPAALGPVYSDLSLGAARSPWEVSGLAEFPGSGSLPYLYGALFVDYLTQRFGPEIIGALWRESGKGSIPKGFDGTLLSRGAFEEVSATRLPELWQDFLKSLDAVQREGGAESTQTGIEVLATTPVLEGRIGPYCADTKVLYYLDLERWGLYRLPIGTGGPAKKLFAADPYLEDIRLSPEGDRLILDWVRSDGRGELHPALYVYDLARDRLEFVGPRQEPDYAEAARNLASPKGSPYLHREQLDAYQGYRYGLIRVGALTLPARVDQKGFMEVLDSPVESVSSLSLLRNTQAAESTSSIALQYSRPGSPPALALLIEKEGVWKLWVHDSVFSGGLEEPVFIDTDSLVFRSRDIEGRQSLRLLDVTAEFLDTQGRSAEVFWTPLQTYRERLREGTEAGRNLEQKQEPVFQLMGDRLFPLALRNSRYPYADRNSLGIRLQGMDITERLDWRASAGWHFGAAMPEASVTLGTNTDSRFLQLNALDAYRSQATAGDFTRLLGLGLNYEYYMRLLPLQRFLWTGCSASLAGLDTAPELRNYFSPDPDYLSLGAGLRLGYSDQYSLPFFPFNLKGMQASVGADYETVSGLADGFSLSGSLKLALPRPSVQLSLYGAYSLEEELVFSPAGRFFNHAGNLYPSALVAPYPSYSEYSGLDTRSPWYGYGELSVRLFSISPWKRMGVLRMPWLPAWTIGGLHMRAGLRAAAMNKGSSAVLASSAFLSLEMELALLAGLAAEGRLVLALEAAWAFDKLLSGGNPLHAGFSFGIRL